jgi:hypothetical protein
MLAEVRDPVHEQPFVLSNVWQSDALWIYVTNTPDARRLSAKFTLAQTPDGPQVWDWVNTRFVRGIKLAWQATADGYRYEVAVPWAALIVSDPTAGMQIGFEAGRGIGGNSFMNLTGRDPDVASNLLKLTLVTPGATVTGVARPEVALRVRLDDFDSVIVPQTISPDSDYFWLDRVTETSVHLTAGEHILRYHYAGSAGENPGLSKVDAFYLQPAIARRVFSHPDGRTFTLTYNTLTGESHWADAATN